MYGDDRGAPTGGGDRAEHGGGGDEAGVATAPSVDGHGASASPPPHTQHASSADASRDAES